MITTNCACGGTNSFTPARPGEKPKDVRHMNEHGQPEACPLKRSGI